MQDGWIDLILTQENSVNAVHQSIQFIYDKKKHNATQKKQSKYVDRTQRQYETALTSALQNNKIMYIDIEDFT